jgi:hypothetical protein
VTQLRYGILPFASLHVALHNGKQPSAETVMRALDEAYASLRAKFGRAALDLDGKLIGSISDS